MIALLIMYQRFSTFQLPLKCFVHLLPLRQFFTAFCLCLLPLLLTLFCLSLPPFHLSLYFFSFHGSTSLPLTSFHFSLSLSQGLSRCHMTNGTTTSRPGYVMQWLSLPRRPPPWCWIGGHTPCWSRAASGHLTKRAQTPATPRKYWSESMLGACVVRGKQGRGAGAAKYKHGWSLLKMWTRIRSPEHIL